MQDPMPLALRCLAAVLVTALLVTASLVLPGEWERPLPDTEIQVAHLEAFAHLYGIVRWFHPSDEASEADWDQLAIAGVRTARSARSAEDLAERLLDLFLPVAPSLRIFLEDEAVLIPDPAAPLDDDTYVRVWEHIGLETTFSPSMGDVYHSTRRMLLSADLPAGARAPESPLLLDLGMGLRAWVATSLYCDSDGTLPHPIGSAEIDRSSTSDGVDPLLADAVVIWNVAKHFSPYFDEIEVDWAATLRSTLHEIVHAGVDFTYNDLRRTLCIPLQDGHAGLWNPPGSGYAKAIPDICTAYVNGDQIVSAVEGEAYDAGVRPGDRILSLDSAPVGDVLSDWMKTISGSEHKRVSLSTTRLMLGRKDSIVELGIEGIDGSIRSVSLARTRSYPVSPRRLDPITEIGPGILYVDVSRAAPEDLDALADALPTYQGVLIDARGYPYDRFWGARFLAQTATSMDLSIPVKYAPDVASLMTETMTAQPQLPEGTQIELVFLINADAFSAGEHQLSYFVNTGLGTFVGTATAGCNGNVNRIALPSGGAFSWTGMRAEWSDGTPFHTVGIEPDVWVEATREGIASGLDEPLDSAVAILLDILNRSPLPGL